jgi:hypothetical protein
MKKLEDSLRSQKAQTMQVRAEAAHLLLVLIHRTVYSGHEVS